MTPGEVQAQFDNRSAEVRRLVDLIKNADTSVSPFTLPNMRLSWLTANEVSILKATTYLVLYNLIEATMGWCQLMVAHAPKRRKRWRPKHLTPPVWKAALIAAISGATASESVSNRIIPLTNQIFKNDPAGEFSYEFSKHDGNWKYKDIKKDAEILGVELKVSSETLATITRSAYIDTITRTRNILAHGEESFEGVGARMTVDEIELMATTTIDYLGDVILSYTDFVERCLFLQEAYRP